MIISNLKSIIQIFYGELFNFKIPFKTRVYRILARGKISKFFENYYISHRKNIKIETFKNNFIKINEDTASEELNSEGITLGINLNEKVLNEILQFIKDKEFKFNRDKNKKIKFSDRYNYRDLYILNYMNPHLENKFIKEILLNEKLISVIKNYLGVDPVLEWSQIYWSLPFRDKNGNILSPPNNEFGYHYDIDGFKFLKVFFYLTDVTGNNGPHVFIKKSGEKTLYKALNRRLNDEEIENKFGKQKIVITGLKGSGFIEDTSFYHKGTNPIEERGILTCLYNISKW